VGYLNLVDLRPILFNKFCQRIVSNQLILQRVEILFRDQAKGWKGSKDSIKGPDRRFCGSFKANMRVRLY